MVLVALSCLGCSFLTSADDDNDAVLFEKIKSGNYDADDPIWENISNEAKDVVAKLLTVCCGRHVREVSCTAGSSVYPACASSCWCAFLPLGTLFDALMHCPVGSTLLSIC